MLLEVPMIFDVAIIGAGVVGSMIARELSMYDVKLCVIEAAQDVAAGTSKANSGIVHAGYDTTPGSLKAKMNALGRSMMKKTTEELGVPYKNCGSMVAAFSEEDESKLKLLFERGIKNGVPVELITSAQVKHLEPMLSGKVTSALYVKTAGIINPYMLTIAAAENAAENGAGFFFGCRVTNIRRQDNGFVITAGEQTLKTRYIVNAAGVFADEISKLAGGESFIIKPRKGEYIIFDTAMEARTGSVIFGTPTKRGKGVLITPTTSGNMLAGPTAQDLTDKENTPTSSKGLADVLENAKRFLPIIDKKYAISVFAGLRAVPERGDFIIENSKLVPNFINVAGIESPGLTSAPAIAKHVADLLFSIGLPDTEKTGAKRERRPIEVFADATQHRKMELIKSGPGYANVVCRCMHVTEAEVLQSLRRPCGARTVDGVKFRTGAGMGRCHGGFCLSRIMHILAAETERDLSKITKSGEGAYILSAKMKEASSES
jgi:glycerol-3-phosphate dehydrogenase